MPISQEPESQPALSLRAGSRTFSFGARAGKFARSAFSRPSVDSSRPSDDSTPIDGLARHRATTESSYASTTTPPKLETDMGSMDLDGLSHILDDIGKRRSVVLVGDFTSAPATDHPVGYDDHATMNGDGSSTPRPDGPWLAEPAERDEGPSPGRVPLTKPAPVHLDGSLESAPSPRSLQSRTSTDMLLQSAPPSGAAVASWTDREFLAISRRETEPPPPPPPPPRAFPSDNARPSPPTTPHSRSSLLMSGGLKRSSAYRDRRSNGTLEDEDTRLLSDPVEARTAWHQRSARLFPRRLVGSRGRSEKVDASFVVQSTTPETVKRDVDTPGTTTTTTRWAEGDGIELSQLSARSTDPPRPGGLRASHTEPILAGAGSLHASASSPSLTPSPDAARSKLEPAGGRRLEPSYRARVSDEMASTRRSDGGDGATAVELDPPSRTATPPSAMFLKEPPSHPGRASLSPGAPRSPQRPPLSGAGARGSSESDPPGRPADDEDDEDEEIPLGILAAHGFPSRTRPPVRMSKAGSTPNLRTMSTLDVRTGSPSSVVGEPSVRDARPSHLPVFARGLPPDPYGGPNPAHPSESTAPALGRNSFASHSMVDLPPGGLVGVIAGEERNRAMRRGHPAMHHGSGAMGMPHAGAPGGLHPYPAATAAAAVGPWMPAAAFGGHPAARHPMAMHGPMPMGVMPGLSPADQAQLQMSQQMTEMMWMQMMWMQQMMQLQGMSTGSPTGAASATPAAPMAPTLNVLPTSHPSRPASVRASSAIGVPGSMQIHPPTMNLLDPTLSFPTPAGAAHPSRFSPPFGPSFVRPTSAHPGYAASMAPSERSNVGLPSRYRPVSAVAPSSEPVDAPPRSVTPGVTPEVRTTADVPPSAPTDPLHPRGRKPSADDDDDDDDDEQAWEEMKRTREQKKLTWKFKKESSPIRDVFVPSM